MTSARRTCRSPDPPDAVARGRGRRSGSRQRRGRRTKPVRFATFNASLNRVVAGRAHHRPLDPGNVQAAQRRRDHPARPPRRPADQRVRLRRGRHARCELFQRQLPRGRRRTGAAADRLPLPLHRAVEHRASRRGFDLNNNGGRDHARRAGTATTPSASASSPASSAWPSTQVPDRRRRRSARSRSSCGRTCRARCCPTTRPPRARRLVLAGRARHLPPVVEEPLGPAVEIGGKTVHFLVSHPTPPVFDGAGGPQRPPQPRRDPASGPTT